MDTPPPPEWYEPEPIRRGPPPPPPIVEPDRQARAVVTGMIIVLTIAAGAWRLVYAAGIHRTAALYIGVPAVLAIGLVHLPRRGSALMMAVRGSTIALLVAGIVLPEGIICLVMAAPFVFLVAICVGAYTDGIERRRQAGRWSGLAIVVPLALASLEGVIGSPFDDRDAVTSTRVVAASPAEIEAALASAPDFAATEVPRFLTWGFNVAVSSTGEGLAVGDERVVHFTGGTHDDHPLRPWGGDGGHGANHATMRLRISESAPGRVVFSVVEDGTMTSRWAELQRTVVTWDTESTTATTGTRVSWTIEYRRLLAPAAYFGPFQRYGMTQAADYLLDATVGPPVA